MRRYHNVSIIVNDLNYDKIQENVKYDKSQKEQFKEFKACLAKWVLVPITQIVASAREHPGALLNMSQNFLWNLKYHTFNPPASCGRLLQNVLKIYNFLHPTKNLPCRRVNSPTNVFVFPIIPPSQLPTVWCQWCTVHIQYAHQHIMSLLNRDQGSWNFVRGFQRS